MYLDVLSLIKRIFPVLLNLVLLLGALQVQISLIYHKGRELYPLYKPNEGYLRSFRAGECSDGPFGAKEFELAFKEEVILK